MANETSRWFMKNIILPNNEIIDKPGYVISRYAGKGTRCFVREVFFPELVISEIERRVIKRYGDRGRKAVYSAGKSWGVRYGITTGLPKKSSMPKKDFGEFMDTFMKFMESEYATRVTYTLDYEKDRFVSEYENLMVCRINGCGQFLTGTMDGAWEYMAGRKTEGLHARCQGRGDKCCRIECARPGSHRDKGKVFKANVPADLGLEKEYFTLNSVRKAQYAKNSFADLLEGRIFSYKGGFFECNGDRFLLNEASSVYFLETELGKLKGGEEILFKAAFDYFKAFGLKNASSALVRDMLPALGWGDIISETSAKKAFVRGYPWTKYAKKTTFPILRGMLSGLVSSYAGKDVIFSNVSQHTSSGSLDLVLVAD